MAEDTLHCCIMCGDQESFKPPFPQLKISYTAAIMCGGQKGFKSLSPQFMLPPEINATVR